MRLIRTALLTIFRFAKRLIFQISLVILPLDTATSYVSGLRHYSLAIPRGGYRRECTPENGPR